MAEELVRMAGSLAAIIALFALARWLRLGGDAPVIADRADAVRLAEEADSAFVPNEVAIDAQGRAALLADARGAIVLLRPHGAHFVGSSPTPAWHVARDGAALRVTLGRRMAPRVELVLPDDRKASHWFDALCAKGVRHG